MYISWKQKVVEKKMNTFVEVFKYNKYKNLAPKLINKFKYATVGINEKVVIFDSRLRRKMANEYINANNWLNAE